MKTTKMTWVGILNIIILQWFFIRLARKIDLNGKTYGFTLLKWIVPLTGWFNDFVFIGNKKGNE